MLEDEEFERRTGIKRKRPSKATRAKKKRLLSPVQEADHAPAPAPMFTRSKSIPKDDVGIVQEALKQVQTKSVC
ncbi:glutamate synthase large subunit [Sesbania bispinosa]|nr:glutamate synthase large subunit [Sesbania bispinosa]